MSGMLPVGFGGSVAAYDIAKSVRFRSSASAYLSRTPASAGNRRTWTWSGWAKRGALNTYQGIFGGGGTTPAYDALRFTDTNTLQFFTGGAVTVSLATTAVFRDPSAWYHIVVLFNTTEATAGSRVVLIVNGVQQTLSGTYPSQNTDWNINTAAPHALCAQVASGTFSFTVDGYLSEINFVDGQALDATSFGQFDANGVWQPKKYTGTYGTNGFYLPFNDGTTLTNLCLDRSGNANNWTASGVSLTAGVNYDWMDDTPTNNFATLNPLNTSTQHAYSSANLLATLSSASDPRFAKGSVFVSSGKWVAEYKPVVASSIGSCGVGDAAAGTSGGGLPTANSVIYFGNGVIYRNGVSQGTFTAYTTANTIRIELDMDALTCAFYRDGTLVTTITGLTSSAYTFGGFANNVSDSFAFNFGQQPWQGGTPSSGFKALSTKNLPAATIENPRLHFDVLTWAGNDTAGRNIAGLQFQPDFSWAKNRSAANNHLLFDSVRTAGKLLISDLTNTESTTTAGINAFNPNGIQVGYDGSAIINKAGNNYVGWNWKAGGAAVTNTSGSISSQVSANTTAGFSVVTYTGTGANATAGHGLGVAPRMIIIKARNLTSDWVAYHAAIGNTAAVFPSNTGASSASSLYWNNTSPTSTTFSLGIAGGVNNSGAQTYVAYCFAEVPGFSKIGSYTGNGSADGPFVYCGFRPRWVLIKNASIAATWLIFDAARGVSNVNGQQLYPNTSDAEVTDNVNNCMDFTANGFKFRGASAVGNGSGNTIVFMAFAETPFQSSRAR